MEHEKPKKKEKFIYSIPKLPFVTLFLFNTTKLLALIFTICTSYVTIAQPSFRYAFILGLRQMNIGFTVKFLIRTGSIP